MSWISDAIGSSLGTLVKEVGGVVDNFHLSGEEKQQFQQAMTKIAQQRESEIEQTIRQQLESKERVLVAELKQDDKFTKRARPTVIYVGLALVAWNYGIAPILGMEPVELPAEFWYGWSGIVGTYAIGRSAEKAGARSKVVSAITGNKQRPSLLE